MNTTLTDIISRWRESRNTAPDDEIDANDADYADRAGLPTLAALLRLRVELGRTARGRAVAAEYITPAIQVAAGEATERLRAITGDDSVSCPAGLGTAGLRVLEMEHRQVTIDESVELCNEWGVRRGHSAPAIRAACGDGSLPAELRGKTWHIAVAALRAWADD